MLTDLRRALRSLIRRSTFSVAVVATLALSIGGAVAVGSVVYAMLLRPLPFHDPDRLVAIEISGGGERGKLSGREVRALSDDSRTLAGVAAFYPSQYNLTGGGAPESLVTMIGTSNLFRVFGVSMLHGDTWPAALDWTSGQYVVVLGHGLWRQRYGSDPAIVGRAVRLDGADYTVAGVLPPGFDYPSGSRLYRAVSGYTTSTARRFSVVARLGPGASLAEAQSELDAFSARFEQEFPDTNRGLRFVVRPLRDVYAGSIRPYLWVLVAGMVFILVLACANISNLLLSRLHAFRGELSLRVALGAGRWAAARQAVVEAGVLTFVGGVCGIGVASWLVHVLMTVVRLDLPEWLEVRIDWPVMLLAGGITLVVGLVLAAGPVLHAATADLRDPVGEGSRRLTGSRRQQATLRALVAVQVAIAVVLLVGASLMTRTVVALARVDPGFSIDRLVTFRTDPPWTRYGGTEAIALFYRRAVERLQALPGVVAATTNQQLPLGGTPDTTRTVFVEGAATVAAADERPFVNFQVVSPNYFEVMRIPLRRGRFLSMTDRLGGPPVGVISERAASRLWPGQDPIGKRLRTMWRVDGTGTSTDVDVSLTIVGVVGDVRFDGIAAGAGMDLYVSVEQTFAGDTFFAIRTSGDPSSVARAVAGAIRDVDPEQSIFDVQLMDTRVSDSVWQPRTAGAVVAVLALLALALAAVGTYGVLAAAVAQREREIGVRMAIGASAADVVRFVIGRGMGPVAIGLVVGLPSSLALSRLLDPVLYGVSRSDQGTYIAVPIVLALVALVACLQPARRAARVDPVQALRAD